jgi:hypothetical protein
LRQAGNPAALRIIDGAHTWDVWSALLPAALKYTLGCVKTSAPTQTPPGPAQEHPSYQRP